MVQRYGGARPGRRRAAVLVVGALAVVFLAWLGWTAWYHSTPPVRGGLVSFTIDSDRQVTATYDARVRNSSSQGSCLLRATATDHQTVGETTVPVTSDGRYRVSFRTERRATSVELVHCATK